MREKSIFKVGEVSELCFIDQHLAFFFIFCAEGKGPMTFLQSPSQIFPNVLFVIIRGIRTGDMGVRYPCNFGKC